MTDNEIPFMAIGVDELGYEVGEFADCPKCGKTHPIIWAEKRLPDGTLKPSRSLGGVRCTDGNDYIVSLGGRRIQMDISEKDFESLKSVKALVKRVGGAEFMDEGWSLLHLAVKYGGNVDVVKYLSELMSEETI